MAFLPPRRASLLVYIGPTRIQPSREWISIKRHLPIHTSMALEDRPLATRWAPPPSSLWSRSLSFGGAAGGLLNFDSTDSTEYMGLTAPSTWAWCCRPAARGRARPTPLTTTTVATRRRPTLRLGALRGNLRRHFTQARRGRSQSSLLFLLPLFPPWGFGENVEECPKQARPESAAVGCRIAHIPSNAREKAVRAARRARLSSVGGRKVASVATRTQKRRQRWW